MPTYTYKVKNQYGKELAGEARMACRSDLIDLILQKGLTPVEIVEKNAMTDISQIGFLKKRVRKKDMAVFCRQFAIVIEAGLSIVTALDVLREQTTNSTLKECLNDIYDNIQRGVALSASMKQHRSIFPDILLSMIEAGEVSGQLDRVLVKAADNLERDQKLNRKVKNTMAYPVIVLCIAVLVVAVLMLKVVPTFVDALTAMNVDLPGFTKALMAISRFTTSWWWAILAGVLAAVIGLRTYSKNDGGRRFFSSLAIKLPVLRNVTKTLMTARMCRTLSTLLSSGVLMLQSLEIVQSVLGNAVIAGRMSSVIEGVKAGRSLTGTLVEMKYFPPLVISMVKVGEESGNIDYSLNKAADFYDQEVEAQLQGLVTLLEPAIMIVLGVIVIFIIFSILYPMIGVYQNMGSNL
jgi:type IV pilus assembly protein PilC